MSKKIEQYTRTELEQIKEVLITKSQELRNYGNTAGIPETVLDAVRRELKLNEHTIELIGIRLASLFSSCLFCRKTSEVEVPTITHICSDCDNRVFGRELS